MIKTTILVFINLNIILAKQDCMPGNWNEWSSCSETCGARGTRQRHRSIQVLPNDGGKRCSEFEFKEIVGCNRICHNGGDMIPEEKCDCRAGWTGECCKLDIDECDFANAGCQHKCINTQGGHTCECYEGFKMNQFEQCTDIDECADDTAGCENICMNVPGSFKCGCLFPKVLEKDGHTCAAENHCNTAAAAAGCSHGCVVLNNQYMCDCPEGYVLDEDGFTCIDEDECKDVSFCTGGKCINTDGEAHCECPAGTGLSSDGKQCIGVDPCQPGLNECSHVCQVVDFGHVCNCPVHMVLGPDRKTCLDENECLRKDNPCSHECWDRVGGYNCLCPEGMELEHDNRTCCEVGVCKHPLSKEQLQYGRTTTDKLVIVFSVLGVVVVTALAFAMWRLLRRTMNTNEKVLRSIRHTGKDDVYFNRHAMENIEMESRGIGIETVTARAEPFHRQNVKSYGADKDEDVIYQK